MEVKLADSIVQLQVEGREGRVRLQAHVLLVHVPAVAAHALLRAEVPRGRQPAKDRVLQSDGHLVAQVVQRVA